MRFNVKPEQTEFTEWLDYSFSDMKVNKGGKNSAIINLRWEKMKIPFTGRLRETKMTLIVNF